jgi:hypothetical protein
MMMAMNPSTVATTPTIESAVQLLTLLLKGKASAELELEGDF